MNDEKSCIHESHISCDSGVPGEKGTKNPEEHLNSIEEIINNKIQNVIDNSDGLVFEERLVKGEKQKNCIIIKNFTEVIEKYLEKKTQERIFTYAYYMFLIDANVYVSV